MRAIVGRRFDESAKCTSLTNSAVPVWLFQFRTSSTVLSLLTRFTSMRKAKPTDGRGNGLPNERSYYPP